MKTRAWKRTVALAGLCVLVFAAARLLPGTGALGEARSEAIQQALAIQDAFVEVAESTAKAVVTISSQGRVSVGDRLGMFYFGPSTAEVRGLGSGVIFDKRGYVLTSDHVIEIITEKRWLYTGHERIPVTVGKVASEIKVTLPDGRSFDAKVQGRDRLLDIAVLKMEGVGGQDLPVAALGDSSKVRVGHLALAIGNPYGSYQYLDSPQPTVTDGIISALGRTFPTDDERRSYGGLIQTSAAINRGNSGGPLVNIHGEVIGINAAIFSTSQGSEGIGFAIPVNRVKTRLKELIAGKKIRYGYLGITPVDLDPVKVEKLARQGANIPRGVYVFDVGRDTPANKAGLKEGDIIVKLGDRVVVNKAQLVDIFANTPEKTKMAVTIVRDGKRIIKNVAIGGWTPPYFTWAGEREG
ncbi:trypsin-like peptidase domain-containing protein [bacterium]|nr:trypsin-like peptidase domain-containing protein [bacterium]